MWMKIKDVDINFNNIITITDIYDVNRCGIHFSHIDGGGRNIYFADKKERDQVRLQIRSKLSKHE